jgi:hypothetical protein
VLSKCLPLNFDKSLTQQGEQTLARLPRTMAESEADLLPALLSARTLATAIDWKVRDESLG